MKAFLYAICVLIALIVCTGCTYTPERQYIDFTIDLSLMERFGDCLTKVEDGSANVFTRAELHALKEDIALWDKDSEAAKQANYYFNECADSLLKAIDYARKGMDADCMVSYDKAKEYYDQAEITLYKINIGDTNV